MSQTKSTVIASYRAQGYKVRGCSRCKGTGKLIHMSHVQEGRCFSCDGVGSVPYGKPVPVSGKSLEEMNAAIKELTKFS